MLSKERARKKRLDVIRTALRMRMRMLGREAAQSGIPGA